MSQAQRDVQKEAGLFFVSLDKVVRQYLLYGRTHNQTQSALDDLARRALDFFSFNDSLNVVVKRREIEFNGTTIFMLEKRENNYIEAMYLDGVRNVTFLPSITRDEFERFAAVLGRDPESRATKEDDTVTLLWKSNIQGIRYETVELDSADFFALLHNIADDNLTEDEQSERDFLERFIYSFLRGEVLEPDLPPATQKYEDEFAKDIQQAVPSDFFKPDEALNEILTKDVGAFAKRDYLSDVALVFCEVLEAEFENRDSFSKLLHAFVDTIRVFLQEGNLDRATDWLKRLRGLQTHLATISVDAVPLVEESLGRLSDSSIFESLGNRIADGMKASADDWIHFFQYMGESAIHGICSMLPSFHQETIHSAFVEYLVDHGQKHVEVFIRHLGHPSWILVRDMVRVLNQLLPETSAISHLRPKTSHPHEEVRLELVRTTRRYSLDYGADILLRALSDRDKKVRMLATQLISKSPAAVFSKSLALMAKQESFAEREGDEKRNTLIALARCAGMSSLDFLNQIVEDAGTGVPQEELRVAALYGLVEIDDPRAQAVIKTWSSKLLAPKMVRDAAKRLLERKTAGAQGEAEYE